MIVDANGGVVCCLSTGELSGAYDSKAVVDVGADIVQAIQAMQKAESE